MMQDLMDYLMGPAHVHRIVNPLYFMVVLLISGSILGYSLYTRNRNAIALFLFAMIVWPLIELFGLLTGWRVYATPYVGAVFVLISIGENPGWVTLAYLVSEKIFDMKWKGKEIK